MYKKIDVKNNVLKMGEHYLVSDYKTRNSLRNKHNGMDIVGKKGDYDIVAIESGKVTYLGYEAGIGGYWVSITTNGIEHRYFHLAKGSIKVKKGDIVQKGEVIAKMGKTGNADIVSLHFAIYKKGYVDPLPYLTRENPFNLDTGNEDTFITFVKGVQEKLGANIDGIPGAETFNKTITISTSTNWNHPIVLVIQKYLKSLGYDLGKYGLDGKFGPDMKKVIMDYQKNIVGLKGNLVDGVITAKRYTWKSLLKLD